MDVNEFWLLWGVGCAYVVGVVVVGVLWLLANVLVDVLAESWRGRFK